MKKTLSNSRSKTKNLARNTVAGLFLANTVSATDLAENLTTSITRPTSNILKTIENTSDALSTALKDTSKWNILHSAGNIATLPVRAAGSIGEWSIKALWGATQYLSGLNQTLNHTLITAGEWGNQSFSTNNEHPDIPHKDINLEKPSTLWRDGTHGVLDHKQTPKSKIIRRLWNVKNSIINVPTNIARIGTDIISYGSQRVRWVVESVEKTAKDIKSSRSGVFTKWQSFGKKVWNIFTKGLRWSATSTVKWVINIAHEWIIKTGVACIGIATNFIGRTAGNVIAPLFTTKARSEQKDNIFTGQSRYDKFTTYYTSTPLESSTTQTTANQWEAKKWKENDEKKDIQDKDAKEEKVENKAEGSNKNSQPEGSNKKEKIEHAATALLWSLASGALMIQAIKKAYKEKDEVTLHQEAKKLISEFETYKDSIAEKDLPKKYQQHWKDIKQTLQDLGDGKYDLSVDNTKPIEKQEKTQWEKEENKWESQENKEQPEATIIPIDKEKSQQESNEAMWEYINQEQKKFTKLYNTNKEISKKDTEKRIQSIQWYHKAGGKIIFTSTQDKDGKVLSGELQSIIIDNDKVKVEFIQDDNTLSDEIALHDVFDNKFSIHIPKDSHKNNN